MSIYLSSSGSSAIGGVQKQSEKESETQLHSD